MNPPIHTTLTPHLAVFVGQGAQYQGMGQEIYKQYDIVRPIFDEAQDIVTPFIGQDFLQTIWQRVSHGSLGGNNDDGHEDQEDKPFFSLKDTLVAQPAIFVCSMALWRIAYHRGLRPQSFAGHSLGEYSALCASGSLDFAETLHVILKRARFMQNVTQSSLSDEVDQIKGGMMAILRAPIGDVQRYLAYRMPTVVVANDNDPTQSVVSGPLDDLHQLKEILSIDYPGWKTRLLDVAGAFHTNYMQKAADVFASHLHHLNLQKPAAPLWMNATATLTNNPQDIKNALIKQMTSGVLWRPILENAYHFFTHRDATTAKADLSIKPNIINEPQCEQDFYVLCCDLPQSKVLENMTQRTLKTARVLQVHL